MTEHYTIEDYHRDLDTLGLSETWEKILSRFTSESNSYGVFFVSTFGDLYEDGLAYIDKYAKKGQGQYFTPADVSHLMSEWFDELEGKNICDVCCGTGNLIISYLKLIGEDRAVKLLTDEKVWLYDIDPVAMSICRKSIEAIWGVKTDDERCIICDFLDRSITLPENCKVICNPPYAKITMISDKWEQTDVLRASGEYYSAIMEKILKSSRASVTITPYSFTCVDKFYPLRRLMNDHNGFITTWDNMPTSVFHGKKHGQFNTNTTNATRAAITVTENKESTKGYRIGGMVRWRAEEREKALDKDYLESICGTTYQCVGEENPISRSNPKTSGLYAKCLPDLENVLSRWVDCSTSYLGDFTSNKGQYALYLPNTCRYFTLASKRDLQRSGKMTLRFDDERKCAYIYCMMNSSFCYWWWRMFDGGMTYTLGLLNSLPCFYDKMTEEEVQGCVNIYREMTEKEEQYLAYKKNAGTMQESVKFPQEYRTRLNNMFLKIIGCSEDSSIFDPVHSNSIN